MRIMSIEPTPNANNMKLNMDDSLPSGVKWDCTRETREHAPAHIKKLLAIPGVRGVYQAADFIALAREPRADWRPILTAARKVFDEAPADPLAPAAEDSRAAGAFGAVKVLVQMLRGIPMQVKLVAGTEEARFGLPDRFKQAAMQAAAASPNVLAERKWADKGVRYGDLQQIGEETAEQIAAAYDEQRLQRLVAHARRQQPGEPAADEQLPPEAVAQRLHDPDWRRRYAALDRLNPTPETLSLVTTALADPHASVRRLAAVYLGEIGGPDVLPYLFQALQDPAVAVRRAAGDCLSDLGDPAAIGPMAGALRDSSHLVRWRAARFLYEVGDGSALPALRAQQHDPEFEVSLQVRLAIERIEGGKEAAGPAWQQMTRMLGTDER